MKTKYTSTLSRMEAKRGDQAQNNPIPRKWRALALGGVLFTSLFGLSAHPVAAQCQEWDFSGKWKIKQGSSTLAVVLSQNGKTADA